MVSRAGRPGRLPLGFGFGLSLGLGFGMVRFARVVVVGAGRDTAGWDAADGTGVAATGAVRAGAGAGAVRVASPRTTGGIGLGVALVFGLAGASVLLVVVVDVFAAGAFTLLWTGSAAERRARAAVRHPRRGPRRSTSAQRGRRMR